MWPDIVISVVSICFGFMVIPQLIDSFKGISFLNIYTAFMTILGLIAIGIAYLAIELWISAISTFFSSCMWILLFSLSMRNRRRKNECTISS